MIWSLVFELIIHNGLNSMNDKSAACKNILNAPIIWESYSYLLEIKTKFKFNWEIVFLNIYDMTTITV